MFKVTYKFRGTGEFSQGKHIESAYHIAPEDAADMATASKLARIFVDGYEKAGGRIISYQVVEVKEDANV